MRRWFPRFRRGRRPKMNLAFGTAGIIGKAVLLPLFLLTFPCTAHAVDKAACVDAHEMSQQTRLQGKLDSSREQLLICAHATCPALVRHDCEKWLADLDTCRSLPRPDAKEAGAPVSTPAVAPASAPTVAPASAAPAPAVTRDGDAANSGVPPDLIAGSTHRPTIRATDAFHVPTLAWAAGALAVVSLGTAAYLGAGGMSQADVLRRTCAPRCDPDDVSGVRTRLRVADLSLLAGVGLTAFAGWTVWDAWKSSGRTSSADSGALSAMATDASLHVSYSATF